MFSLFITFLGLAGLSIAKQTNCCIAEKFISGIYAMSSTSGIGINITMFSMFGAVYVDFIGSREALDLTVRNLQSQEIVHVREVLDIKNSEVYVIFDNNQCMQFPLPVKLPPMCFGPKYDVPLVTEVTLSKNWNVELYQLGHSTSSWSINSGIGIDPKTCQIVSSVSQLSGAYGFQVETFSNLYDTEAGVIKDPHVFDVPAHCTPVDQAALMRVHHKLAYL
jgi:hypothetical protein